MPVERDAERLRQLVFRDEADGHDQRVAVDALLRAGDGAHGLVDLRDLHAREPVCAEHARDRVAQVQRDAVVMQALVDVARQAGGGGLGLVHAEDLRALERQAAGHDEPDVAAAEDDAAPGRQLAEQVRKMLRGAGREHARRARAVDKDLFCRALAAAGGQHERAGVIAHDAVAADGDDREAGGRFLHARDERLCVRLDAQILEPVDEALDIFRPGQPLAEAGEAKAVVNALFEHAAQARLALDEQHVRTVFVRGDGGREPAGAAADDDDVVHHACTSPDFVGPNVMGASAEDLRTALSGTPRYSAMMRTTCGEQNPP